MWDKVREAAKLERLQLRRLLDEYRPLVDRCAANAPSHFELAALSAMLHSFYTGVENIFKRIAVDLDGRTPRGDVWHRQLLDSMKAPGRGRPAVVSEELATNLDDYLTFRHFFRHAYTFDLRWDRMKPLVLGCEETLRILESELDRFFAAGSGSTHEPE